MRDQKLVKALQAIQRRAGGLLRPVDVVEAARAEKSPLHAYFDWNDSEAASKWRLVQARTLIREVQVQLVPNPKAGFVRAFVSLTPDRQECGGGYGAIAEVLSSEEHARQLIVDALAELNVVRTKYQQLQQLRPVFDAIDRVESEQGMTAGKTRAA